MRFSRVRTSFKIACCLGLLSGGVTLAACALGLFPDPEAIATKHRVALCESLAIHCSVLTEKGDAQVVEATLREISARNSDILSMALKRAGGRTLVEIGPHSRHWRINAQGAKSANLYVPISAANGRWGGLEIAFEPTPGASLARFWEAPWLQFVVFVALLNLLSFSFYLGRTLTQLDPSKAVPPRVRTALDTFSEGLMILDERGRIVLANRVLGEILGFASDALEGRAASQLPISNLDDAFNRPWEDTLKRGVQRKGVTMALTCPDAQPQVFKVNTSVILDEQGQRRGVFATFDDITALEQKKHELTQMLEALKRSRAEIQEQNKHLQYLATRDPLTGCLNRRSFFEQFNQSWEDAFQWRQPLCAVMVDVDFFKSINDNYGHAMGDEVLRKVGKTLRESARDGDFVCRYGGEEFCVLLVGADLSGAAQFAERLRLQLAALQFPDELKITASLGASSIRLGAKDPEELLDQADKCLYVAKRNGRNQVVRFDNVPPDLEVDESKISRTPPQQNADIPQTEASAHAI